MKNIKIEEIHPQYTLGDKYKIKDNNTDYFNITKQR